MPISIGQKYHSGQKFINDLNSMAKRNGAIIIALADTLHRYTLQLNDTPEEAFKKALEQGDKWLDTQYSAIQEVRQNHPQCHIYIIRWDEWLNYSNPNLKFKDKKDFVDGLYESDDKFEKSINSSVGEFIRRNIARNAFDLEKAKALSLKYKLEESAVMLVWIELKIKRLAYPNSLCNGLGNIYRRFAQPNNLLEYTDLSKLANSTSKFFTQQTQQPVDIDGFARIACSPIDIIITASISSPIDQIRFLDRMEYEIKKYKHRVAESQKQSCSW
jgi:hypothetical protein